MTPPKRSVRATTSRPNLQHAGGFTLIEVLVALTIVALCLVAGLRAAGAMTNNAERLKVNGLAQWCAENELTEMRLTRNFPNIGENAFSCTQLSRNFSGRMNVAGTPNPNFRRVEAQVFDEQNRPLLTITTIVGRY